MNYLSIDYLILYAFLAVILVIGYRAGRNVKDMRDFAVGNRKGYGTMPLVFTFLSTYIGGWAVMEGIACAFNYGIIGTLAYSGLFVFFVFMALFIAPKMIYFRDCLSLADVIRVLYGKNAQIVAGVLSMICCIWVVVFGLYVFGIFCSEILNVNPWLGIIISGYIVTLYTAHGGIKSVIVTDIIQFSTIFIVILLLAGLTVKQVGGFSGLFNALPNEKYEVLNHEKFSYYMTSFVSWSILFVCITDPPIFQRLLIAKNTINLKNQYIIVSFIDPIVRISLMIIGLGAVILYPTVKPTYILPCVINSLSLSLVFKGITMAGLLAVVMGCIDSYLHVAGVLLVNDIINPILDYSSKEHKNFNFVRYGIFLIGAISITIALRALQLLGIFYPGRVNPRSFTWNCSQHRT